MASRRDQLNAYTFAKRRMLAAFLQSSPDGSEEGAPRPLRAVLPGIIVGIVVMAVFGAWGMFKPTAPKGWDEPNAKVIVASKSTTRYVVLKTDGQAQLHPVLNMASAKLLLQAGQGDVVTVAESVLDNGRIPHGVTIGIPYAPDRLPSAEDAGTAKRWVVCERPSAGGDGSVQKAALVLSSRDVKAIEGRGRLSGGQLLYVADRDGRHYVVDAGGTAYPIDKGDELLLRAVVGSGRQPQRVSAGWLDTLHRGDAITFPDITGRPGDAADAPGRLGRATDKVGMVLRAMDNNAVQYYVVLPGRIAPVSAFVAQLLLFSEELAPLGQAGQARQVGPGEIVPGTAFGTEHHWPTGDPAPVNEASSAKGSRSTICNVLRGVNAATGATTLSTWAGTDFPERLPAGSSAYVTPGSGQLYRQFQGEATRTGPVFLVTDTGLRYVLQSNGDSATDDAGIGTTAEQREQQQKEAMQAQTLLGYKDVDPAPIPAAWSEFLPTGPRLSTAAARQPQGS
ncbi:type VII secretion protein EccB [Streptomyces chromofuscus]|uniref:Type VII secretion protein EccB n=1 Tax=Streptomyces chromofuscus TaxID=42881 RepID=A0A7M2T7J4_STRCW|nr:type VII secretion protein EccB [Streptomyces chromofuscus]QOV43381.1 type VII secretion protein EccB [Streptomyces chromofuscus]GGT41761.1 type VII secretion protein EccB [Streptomyces chromofuscus]